MGHVTTLQDLKPIRESLRAEGKRVVFTNGCFDLLHVGHVSYLRCARSMGDCLIVAINSDRAVKELKGPSRPITPESERAEMLAALEMIDYVFVFDDISPREVIAALLPDVLVKGGDWTADKIIGREEVEGAGGTVLSLPFVDGASTSDLLARVLERFAPESSSGGRCARNRL